MKQNRPGNGSYTCEVVESRRDIYDEEDRHTLNEGKAGSSGYAKASDEVQGEMRLEGHRDFVSGVSAKPK